jgi:hypothetical protein
MIGNTAFMLDTNDLNEFCDGTLSLDCLRGRRVTATGIQEAEMWNCPNEPRRNALLDTFEKVNAEAALGSHQPALLRNQIGR